MITYVWLDLQFNESRRLEMWSDSEHLVGVRLRLKFGKDKVLRYWRNIFGADGTLD